jgi:hypothetical protein
VQVDPAMVDLQHLSQLTQLQFPQQRGKNVHALWVSECPHLRCINVDHLTALELLRVKGCSALEAVHGCSALCSLATLDLCGCTAQGVRHLALARCICAALPDSHTHRRLYLLCAVHQLCPTSVGLAQRLRATQAHRILSCAFRSNVLLRHTLLHN